MGNSLNQPCSCYSTIFAALNIEFDKASSYLPSLPNEKAAKLLLTILHNDMRAIVERYITRQRQAIVAAVENGGDKYKVTLDEIERERDAAAVVWGYLEGLGYV